MNEPMVKDEAVSLHGMLAEPEQLDIEFMVGGRRLDDPRGIWADPVTGLIFQKCGGGRRRLPAVRGY